MSINKPQGISKAKQITFTPKHKGELANTLSADVDSHKILYGLELFCRIKGLTAKEAKQIDSSKGLIKNIEQEHKQAIAAALGATQKSLKKLQSSRLSDYGQAA